MAGAVSEVGREIIIGTVAENTAAVTPISINAATSLIIPAIPHGTTPQSTGKTSISSSQISGPWEATVVVEGASNSRYTTNQVVPTAAIGQLVVPSNGVATILLRGRDVIKNFQIIGVAAGNAITYEYYSPDRDE